MIDRIKSKIQNDIHLTELLKGSSIAFVLRIFGILAGYIFTLLITRGYGAEAMGVFALSITLLQMSSVIGRLGMDTALLRFVAEYSSQGKWEVVKDIYKKAIKIVLPFSIVLSVIIFFLSPFIAEYIFKKPHLSPYFQIVSIGIVPFVLLFIHSQAIRGLKKIKEFMFLQQLGLFLFSSIFLTLFLFFLQRNILIPLIAYIISLVLISFLSLYLWLKFLKKPLSNNNQIKENIKSSFILKVSFSLLISTSLSMVLMWTDTIMLGIFTDETEVGIYNIALKVAMLTSLALTSVNSIAAPKFAEYLSNQDNLELKKIFKKSSKILLIILSPIVTFILLCPSFILKIFGNIFVNGKDVLILLTISQVINTFSALAGMMLSMTGKQIVDQNINIIVVLINLFLNFFLIQIFGIIGAALSTLISFLVRNIILFIYIKNHFRFSIYNFL